MSTTELLVRDNQRGGSSARTTAPRAQDPGPKPSEVTERETLVSITGIVDIPDNNRAFVRTSGYLPGPEDVYVTPAQIRAYGLRKGDLVTGAARPVETREKSPHRNPGRSPSRGPGRRRSRWYAWTPWPARRLQQFVTGRTSPN
jgi:hypothetical protein